jgi:hypothetical protein
MSAQAVSHGGDYLVLAQGDRYGDPEALCYDLTEELGPDLEWTFDVETGLVVVTPGPGVTSWAVDFGTLALAQYLGWAAQVIDQDSGHGPVAGWYRRNIKESWGYGPAIKTMDRGDQDGRFTSTMPQTTTDRFILWAHRRSHTLTWGQDITLLFAAADCWVRHRIAWRSTEDDVWHYGALVSGWEVAPGSSDDAAVAIELEVVE